MLKFLYAFSIVVSLISCQKDSNFSKLCYSVEEKIGNNTHLTYIISDKNNKTKVYGQDISHPFLVLREFKNNKEIKDSPVKLPGLEAGDGFFKTADGFIVTFDDKHMKWPEKSILANINFKKSACPN